MTHAQKAALDFVTRHFAEHGFSPSYDEIAAHLGVKSKSHAHRIVSALIAQGWLCRNTDRARALYPPELSEFERGRTVGYRQGFSAALRENSPVRDVVNT